MIGVHQGHEEIGGNGKIDLLPDFFIITRYFDVGGRGSRGILGMGMVDHLKVEALLSDILLGVGELQHIHDERNFSALFR